MRIRVLLALTAGVLSAQRPLPVNPPTAPLQPVAASSGASRLLRWKMAYLYDEDASSLVLHDIHFPSSKCAFALGTQITRGKGKPVALRSLDNGKTWSLSPLKHHGRSAFFLSDRLGWVVTEDGLARTSDCGGVWERVGREMGLARVWFRDEALGWAVGAPKKALTTRDGGRTWTKLTPSNNPTSNAERNVYAWVEFANDKFGAIVGWHTPQRRDAQFPVWMDPESAQTRRQFPALTLMLQTLDGGAAWKGFTVSLMGRMTRLRLAPPGGGLALIEFDESFEYPSEVYRLDAGDKEIRRVYRHKEHAVTDMAMAPDGWSYLAGVQTPGTIRLPVPGKVKILRSRDGSVWTEDPADYRATANRVYLAKSPDGKLIAATDTGMILRLE